MNEEILNVLVIEDDDNDYKLLLRELKKANIQSTSMRVDTVEQLQSAFIEKKWDIVISDNNIPDRRVSVQSSLKMARQSDPNIPFIIVSGTIGDENAVQLMKLGVQDYILKDNLSRLGPAIKREVADASVREKQQDAEKNLVKSQERYRMLAESITDMFFALDHNLICTFWNKAAEKMTGVDLATAVGKYVFDILPDANNPELRQKLLDCFRSTTSNTIEIEYRRSRQIHYYEVTVYPSSEIQTVIVKDISESKNITRKLQAVNHELETFLYRLSHDLRGPVASVQGLINLARTEKLPLLESDFFSRINLMAGRMDAVISSFSDVVRIKQDTPEIKATSIQSVMENVTRNVDCSGCDVHISMEHAQADGRLFTDPDFLAIAIENILENAVAYQHPDRKPKLNIQFSEKEFEFFQVVIADNGIGIPEELLDKIFTMFFRGNAQSSGPGLGLYLAQNAVEKLGGSIHVKSVVDEGSSFSIRLPYDSLPSQSFDQFVVSTE